MCEILCTYAQNGPNFRPVFLLSADAMEASQMYCDLPPQSAFNFAGYNGLHGLPPTPPRTEEDPTAATPAAQDDCGGGSVVPTKRQRHATETARAVATTAAATATTTCPDDRLRSESCKRPKRESAPSPDIDIVSVGVVRSSSPEVQLKPRQEKIWRPYGATDE